MRENRVRIADIAQELGLSTATVSNVIHGKAGRVSPETARRVQELLEKRRYIPSMAGILLAQNDSRIIGVVIHDHPKYEGRTLEDGFIAASLDALSRETERAGYFMMVKVTTDWEQIPRYASMWNMVGLVVIGFCKADYQSLRDNMHIPFAVYDGFLEAGRGLADLEIDDFDGGVRMGRHLLELGHRRVLFLADNDKDMDRRRYEGLRSVIPGSQLLVIPMERKERRDFYEQRLDCIRIFTAAFAASDYYAADLMCFLQSRGISVPEDFSVAGFDDSGLSRQVRPALTTVRQDHRRRAALAVEALERLRAGADVQTSRVLPVTLVARESTAKARG